MPPAGQQSRVYRETIARITALQFAETAIKRQKNPDIKLLLQLNNYPESGHCLDRNAGVAATKAQNAGQQSF